MIGVASIAPLVFLMSAKAEIPPDQQPQFSINIPYAYIGNYWDDSSKTDNQSTYGWVYSIVFNATPNFDPKTIIASDAAVSVFEYYLIEISSDKGFIGNVTYVHTYANWNTTKPFEHFFFSRDHWFDSNSSRDAFLITFWENGTSLGFKTGPGTDWNRSLGEPQTIFISMRRQGWLILNNNSTIAHLASPEVILQIQLEKYGDGFLYNNIIPEDELSQIDPLMPQIKLIK